MRRLVARDAFSAGTLLRVFAGLGTIIGSGDQIASLIPARDQMITRALVRQAGRTLRTRSCRRVEEVATGAVALTQMALDLANAGDIGTARTVTQNVARLVAEHTAAARQARTQTFRRQALRAAESPAPADARLEASSLRANPRRGHAFVQNLRRGHYDVATDTPSRHRLRIAFDDLVITI